MTELPPIEARIIEYQCYRVACPECGEGTRAPLPQDVKGDFGPQLTALIAYLTVNCRLPRRVVEELLGQVLGIRISLGSAQKCWEESGQAVAAPCQELEKQLKNELVPQHSGLSFCRNYCPPQPKTSPFIVAKLTHLKCFNSNLPIHGT